jgi:hypothetical protein
LKAEKLFWFIFAGELAWMVAPLVTFILGLSDGAEHPTSYLLFSEANCSVVEMNSTKLGRRKSLRGLQPFLKLSIFCRPGLSLIRSNPISINVHFTDHG